MTKTAASKTTDAFKVREAKRAFFYSLFDLTWRMLLGMAVPVFIGAYLDKKFGTEDLFTAFGFLLSLVVAGIVIKYMYDKLAPKDTK